MFCPSSCAVVCAARGPALDVRSEHLARLFVPDLPDDDRRAAVVARVAGLVNERAGIEAQIPDL